MSTGLKANPDGSAAIQVGGTDVITLTSGGAATFVTSPTTVQAGTAAAPSITTSGDTNTGIFFPAADTIAFAEGGAEALRINSSGTVVLSGGDTSANGTGITFPATQSGSSNANTLDDYEEGTWTPQLTFGNANVGMTGTFSGRYTKIGSVVTLNVFVQLSNKGSSTGAAQITNLPFNPVTVSQPYAAVTIYVSALITLSSGQIVQPNINGTVTKMDLNGVTTTTGVDFNLTHANFTSSGTFWLNATYITNT